MSTQTNKSSFKQTEELAAARIGVVMDPQVLAANSQSLGASGARRFLSTLPALAVLIASAWAVGHEGTAGIVQAGLWASGLLFLAFAIGSNETGFGEKLFSGLALLLVASISAALAIEFAVVGAAIVAAWISAAIIRL